MNIAYLISAHTDPQQLHRLTDALATPSTHFFVHIDRKSDIVPFLTAIDNPQVHFLDQRVDVRWGTILEVDYQMLLLQAALDFPLHFDRLMTLSGLDYPLWSNQRIAHYFEQQKGHEILSGYDLATPGTPSENTIIYRLARPFFAVPFLSNKRNQQLSILCRKVRAALGLRKPLTLPNGWHLYKGAAWWAISEELGRYVYDTWTAHPELRRYFTDSFGQAETVVQTITFNHPDWRQRCIHFTDHYPGLVALTPLHFIVYDGAIRIMTAPDLSMLLDSGKMFTRKLTSAQSQPLVQLLEEHRAADSHHSNNSHHP